MDVFINTLYIFCQHSFCATSPLNATFRHTSFVSFFILIVLICLSCAAATFCIPQQPYKLMGWDHSCVFVHLLAFLLSQWDILYLLLSSCNDTIVTEPFRLLQGC